MIELKRCPFCGGGAVMVEGKYVAYGKYSVTCGKCFSATAWEDTEQAAEMRWNSRGYVEDPICCKDCKWGQVDGIGVMHWHKYHIHKAEDGFCDAGEKRAIKI